MRFVPRILLILFFLSTVAVSADDGLGGNLPSLLGFGVGGKANAMANTFTAIANDPSAIYWNPAGLPQIKAREVMFEVYNSSSSSLSILYGAFVNPLPTGDTFGLSIFYFDIEHLMFRDELKNPQNEFNSRQFLVSFAYGRSFSKVFSAGLTLKMLNQSILDKLANIVNLDAGILLKPFSFFSFGLSAQNLIPLTYSFVNAEESIPLNLAAGVDFSFLKDRVHIAADASKLMLSSFSASPLRWNAGLCVNVRDYLEVMAGVNDALLFTFGLGVNVSDVHFYTGLRQNQMSPQDVSAFDFQISLVYKLKEITSTGKELDYFYKGTVFYNNRDYRNAMKYFEKVLEIRTDPTAQYYLENCRKYLASEQWMSDEERSLIKLNLDKANNAKADKDVGGAIQAYRDVLNVNPENKEALQEIENLKQQAEKDVRTLYNEALSFYKMENFKEAMGKVKAALALNPEHKPSLELKAKCDVALKDILGAEQQQEQKQIEAHTLFETGLTNYRQEKWAESISYFQKSLDIIPDDANVNEYINKAKNNLKVSKSLDSRKKDAEQFYKNGQAFYGNKKLKDAITELEKAVNTYPDYKEAQDLLDKVQQEYNDIINGPLEDGKKFLRDNQLGDAIVSFRKVLEIDPNNAIAKEYLAKAQSLTKDSITLYNNQGDIFFKQGKYPDALKEYRQTLLLDPGNLNATAGSKKCRDKMKDMLDGYLKLAIDQYNGGKYDKSIENFNKVLDIDPDYQVAKDYIDKAKELFDKNKTLYQQQDFLSKGKDFFVNRDYDSAKKSFQKVLDIDPESDQGKEAKDWMKKCDDNMSQMNKEDTIAKKFTEGIIAFKNRKYEEAVTIWQGIKDIDPENKFVDQYIQYAQTAQQEKGNKNYNDGVDAYKAGDFIKARDNFKKAIEVDPKHAKAKEYLSKVNTRIITIVQDNKDKGQLAFDKGSYQDALNSWNEVLKYEADNEEILEGTAKAQNLITLLASGSTAIDKGQFADAYDFYKQVLDINPKDVVAENNMRRAVDEGKKQAEQWYTEALSFIDQGQLRKAQSRLMSVIKAAPDNKNAKTKLGEVEAKINDLLNAAYNNGVTAFNAGRFGSAVQEFNKVLDLKNPFKDAFSLRERAQREQNRTDERDTAAMKQKAQEYMVEGIRLYRNDQLAEAIAQWEKVLKVFPDDPQAQKYIQRAKYKMEQMNK